MNNKDLEFNFLQQTLSDQIPVNSQPSDLDGFIKFILAALLCAIPFFLQSYKSFTVLTVYLILATLILRIKPKILLISVTSYCLIVLIPCLFGIAVNTFLQSLTSFSFFIINMDIFRLVLRLICLFFVWYISILFFYTTTLKTIMGLLGKLLSPLSVIGIPIKDYLKVMICIIIELQRRRSQIKEFFLKTFRPALGNNPDKLRINFRGIASIIVALLVNSLENLNHIENMIENISDKELGYYQFKFSIKEGLALISFAFLTSTIFFIEKGLFL